MYFKNEDIKQMNLGYWEDFWKKNTEFGGFRFDLDGESQKDIFKKLDKKRHTQEPDLTKYFEQLLLEGRDLLEIGCGIGTDLREFASRKARVFGFDFSPYNSLISDYGLRLYGLDGVVILADAEALPFPDCCFDIVYSWGVMHHTPNTDKAISEVYRVLRPGGTAAVMLYHKGIQYLLIMGRYILKLCWLRMRRREFISYAYDKTPLSQIFSKGEIRQLFHDFDITSIQINLYGGLKDHRYLKVAYKLFQIFPLLKHIFGTQAFITAKKRLESGKLNQKPEVVCPLCRTSLTKRDEGLVCGNDKCAKKFDIYKTIPVLHDYNLDDVIVTGDDAMKEKTLTSNLYRKWVK